jgi:hypothetical protein
MLRLIASMAELQKADPRARRTALTIVAAGALAGTALLAMATALRPSFEAWIGEDMPSRLRLVMVTLSLFAVVPPLWMSAYLWRLGGRAIRAERFPTADRRVVRDTPVLTGAAARRRGRWLQILAAVLAGGVMLLGVLLWRLLSLLSATAAV